MFDIASCTRREDVDEHLRHRERFGDPMAHLVKKRPVVEDSIIPAALQKRMKKAGFQRIVGSSVTSALLAIDTISVLAGTGMVWTVAQALRKKCSRS